MPKLQSEPLNIRLTGSEWTPPGYADAPLERKNRWWSQLALVAYAIKREEILDGIGANGRKLKPVKSEYRRSGSGPPLAPHGVSSRTYRLLKHSSGKDGATLYWLGGWKTIVGYHAYKHGPRSLPVRDTIGISPRGRKRVMGLAISLWSNLKKPKPKPESKPKPKVSRTSEGTAKKVELAKERVLAQAKARVEIEAIRPSGPIPTIRGYGNVSVGKIDEVREMLNRVPASIRSRLADHGIEIAVSGKLIDVNPELAGVRPHGWPEGMSWENAEGLYNGPRKQVVVAETHKLEDDYVKTSRFNSTLMHELGHAVDSVFGNFSRSGHKSEFAKAHLLDSEAIVDQSEKDKLAYFLQGRGYGSAEAFAELFAWEVGGVGTIRTDIRKNFPRSLEVLRGMLEASG